jgi:hypothetical protein
MLGINKLMLQNFCSEIFKDIFKIVPSFQRYSTSLCVLFGFFLDNYDRKSQIFFARLVVIGRAPTYLHLPPIKILTAGRGGAGEGGVLRGQLVREFSMFNCESI